MMKKLLTLLLVLAAVPAFAASNPVNLNTASKDKLMKDLDGITSSEADAIVNYRKKNGAFVTIHDLTFADGPGPNWARKVIMANEGNLTVGDVSAADRK